MMNVTVALKCELWKRFGTNQHPSEWDGAVYGGGKLSQRYWEYFKAIELLNLSEDSVVLDIGGGSPVTGAGFFADLLASSIRKVIILDASAKNDAMAPPNIEYVKANASYEVLKELFAARPEITHIASISVFEHIESSVREGTIRAINEFFRGDCFIATFEYHANKRYFGHLLTARTISDLFSPFTNFFLDDFSSSPVRCENAFEKKLTIKIGRNNPFAQSNIPLWYPVAVRFIRAV